MSEYFTKTQTISHHLAMIREPIFDRDLVMYALAGLSNNSSYNPFVVAINMSQPKPNFSSFHSQLETFERMTLHQSCIEKDKSISC